MVIIMALVHVHLDIVAEFSFLSCFADSDLKPNGLEKSGAKGHHSQGQGGSLVLCGGQVPVPLCWHWGGGRVPPGLPCV